MTISRIARPLFVGSLVASTFLAPAALSAGGGVSAGMLTCQLANDTNIVVFSKESFDCTYQTVKGDTGHYAGAINRVGADLEFKSVQTLKWAVFAPATMTTADILHGNYYGGSASASVVAGAGARALVGGSNEKITLQPVSLSGQIGAGASATLDRFTLRYTGG